MSDRNQLIRYANKLQNTPYDNNKIPFFLSMTLKFIFLLPLIIFSIIYIIISYINPIYQITIIYLIVAITGTLYIFIISRKALNYIKAKVKESDKLVYKDFQFILTLDYQIVRVIKFIIGKEKMLNIINFIVISPQSILKNASCKIKEIDYSKNIEK